MKTLRFYSISKDDYDGTNYRPVGVETEEIKTEDGWNVGDVLENLGIGLTAETVKETGDIIIWKCSKTGDDSIEQYIVEIKGVI